MPNVHCIVSGHNKTILNKQNKTETTKNQTTEKSSECNIYKYYLVKVDYIVYCGQKNE
jgi:hypothetical protein